MQPLPQLTSTEATTLAVFLDSAARKMARAKRGTTYVWDRPFEATSDMFRMFYDLASVANVGVII